MSTDEQTHESRSRRTLVAAVVAVVCALAIVGGLLLILLSGGDESAELIEVVVPAGTGERIEAGEEVELFPRTLDVEVGDSIVIRNQDDQTHQVGPYIVAGGQTIEQTFTEEGTIEGVCTLHPSGEVTINVN